MSPPGRPQPEAEGLRMLTLPGWRNSNADHWQTHWERASFVVAGALGHLNGGSGLADWPQGRALVDALAALAPAAAKPATASRPRPIDRQKEH